MTDINRSGKQQSYPHKHNGKIDAQSAQSPPALVMSSGGSNEPGRAAGNGTTAATGSASGAGGGGGSLKRNNSHHQRAKKSQHANTIERGTSIGEYGHGSLERGGVGGHYHLHQVGTVGTRSGAGSGLAKSWGSKNSSSSQSQSTSLGGAGCPGVGTPTPPPPGPDAGSTGRPPGSGTGTKLMPTVKTEATLGEDFKRFHTLRNSYGGKSNLNIIPNPLRPLYQYSLDRKNPRQHTYTCEQNAQILLRLEKDRQKKFGSMGKLHLATSTGDLSMAATAMQRHSSITGASVPTSSVSTPTPTPPPPLASSSNGPKGSGNTCKGAAAAAVNVLTFDCQHGPQFPRGGDNYAESLPEFTASQRTGECFLRNPDLSSRDGSIHPIPGRSNREWFSTANNRNNLPLEYRNQEASNGSPENRKDRGPTVRFRVVNISMSATPGALPTGTSGHR
uniref:Uncharacterized protein n=1 Tax=Anopheles atroparvus TaxID=41427 RepID=A0A182IVW1_ANOAO